jgi:hypothetical protein
MSQGGYSDWTLYLETCLGHPLPTWGDEDRQKSGTYTENGIQLRIGDDTYETQAHELAGVEWFTLYKNGRRQKTLFGKFETHSPDISLKNAGGKVAWEFASDRQSTIIYDGQDVRSLYDLEAAYRPYEMAGKLIFVGQKNGRYFVVYDGQRIGSDFDEITIAYCCESALYSVRTGQGEYLFWGSRGGRRYVVEITAR